MELIILVDSGGTHSFLDKKVDEELKIPLVLMLEIFVIVADGKGESDSITPNFH